MRQQQLQQRQPLQKKRDEYDEKAEEELKDVVDTNLLEQLSSIDFSADTEAAQDADNDSELGTDDEEVDASDDPKPSEQDQALNGSTDKPKRPEPWLRMKPNWNEQNRMPMESPEIKELKDWLESNKFGQFFEKMYESGVETLNDLRVLKTENDIMELVGPSGINMGVIFRRKFIRLVLSLSEQVDGTSSMTNGNDTGTNSKQKKNNSTAEVEQQALNDVMTTLKDHTEQLKVSREDLASVKKQVEETRKMIAELFDKAMGVLLVRRKNLENSINSIEAETTETLKKRVNDLQNSAKICSNANKQLSNNSEEWQVDRRDNNLSPVQLKQH